MSNKLPKEITDRFRAAMDRFEVEELEDLMLKIVCDAYQAGRDNGFLDGVEQGRSVGFTEGYEAGNPGAVQRDYDAQDRYQDDAYDRDEAGE